MRPIPIVAVLLPTAGGAAAQAGGDGPGGAVPGGASHALADGTAARATSRAPGEATSPNGAARDNFGTCGAAR